MEIKRYMALYLPNMVNDKAHWFFAAVPFAVLIWQKVTQVRTLCHTADSLHRTIFPALCVQGFSLPAPFHVVPPFCYLRHEVCVCTYSVFQLQGKSNPQLSFSLWIKLTFFSTSLSLLFTFSSLIWSKKIEKVILGFCYINKSMTHKRKKHNYHDFHFFKWTSPQLQYSVGYWIWMEIPEDYLLSCRHLYQNQNMSKEDNKQEKFSFRTSSVLSCFYYSLVWNNGYCKIFHFDKVKT